MTTDAELVRAIAARFLTEAGKAEVEEKLVGRNVLAAKLYLYGALETLVDGSEFSTAEIQEHQKKLELRESDIAQVRNHPAIFHH